MTKKENIPNLLTMLRIIMIPIFLMITSFSQERSWHIAIALIFAVASLTDYLDGYLARKWHVVTNFGKFADPLADKMLVMSAFIMLVGLNLAPAWVSAIIICRELAVTGLRLLLVESGGEILAAAYAWKNKNSNSNVFCNLLIVSLDAIRKYLALCCSFLYNLFRLRLF
ncbi:CDP-diacylglycerol--glycerol-3-phosphate 3-phosphatidyltransferase [Streptococcus iniae]|uniref:CDP-diacylglycerol--glycerol-3-phosphate 3-phosphatidyltransferase n=1 Tax=Streptococcus iniae TaxID=1346 RepID=UPI002B2B4BDA|nr:CDP-diacylglycerol--glycerol-3-phosphate 3-phosphatidyltransferase [Streptococcus iniae]